MQSSDPISSFQIKNNSRLEFQIKNLKKIILSKVHLSTLQVSLNSPSDAFSLVKKEISAFEQRKHSKPLLELENILSLIHL